MKKYKVAYSHIKNAGDLLNVYILKELFQVEAICTGYLSADIIGIGSCLGECQFSDKLGRHIRQILYPFKTTFVWGTGFMFEERENEPKFANKKMIFSALRGKLTKNRVEKILGEELENIPLCDGGILTANIFKENIVPKYRLGVIPHYKEQNYPGFEKLLKLSTDSVLIDLRKNPMDVYRQIGECEVIISSSLHGLIIADSFGIPNLHVKATDNLLGDGYKFRDYYSGYDLEDNYVDLEKRIPELSEVYERYQIQRDIVEQKKKEMIKAFPVI